MSTPLAIGDGAIAGMGTAEKIAANTYNAGVSAIGSFGTAGMTGGNPDVSAAFTFGSSGLGTLVKTLFPGAMGNFLNNMIQGAAGPIQNAITQDSPSQ